MGAPSLLRNRRVDTTCKLEHAPLLATSPHPLPLRSEIPGLWQGLGCWELWLLQGTQAGVGGAHKPPGPTAAGLPLVQPQLDRRPLF